MLFRKYSSEQNSVDTGRKLNVHKMFRRRRGCLLNVLCTFNLLPVPTGNMSQTLNYIDQGSRV